MPTCSYSLGLLRLFDPLELLLLFEFEKSRSLFCFLLFFLVEFDIHELLNILVFYSRAVAAFASAVVRVELVTSELKQILLYDRKHLVIMSPSSLGLSMLLPALIHIDTRPGVQYFPLMNIITFLFKFRFRHLQVVTFVLPQQVVNAVSLLIFLLEHQIVDAAPLVTLGVFFFEFHVS